MKSIYISSPFSLIRRTLYKELKNVQVQPKLIKNAYEIEDRKNSLLILDLDENDAILHALQIRKFHYLQVVPITIHPKNHPFPTIAKQSKILLSPKFIETLHHFSPLPFSTLRNAMNIQQHNTSFPTVSSPLLNNIPKIILIGVSTGGPKLIEKIVRTLPPSYPFPICIVQHMPKNFTSLFAQRLNTLTELTVIEAKENEEIVPGKIIIAKGGWHLHFKRRGSKILVKLAKNIHNRFFTPSVDEMFLSALQNLDPKQIIAILLTGIGDDGADGMVKLKQAGAYTIAESQKSATVYGMPKAAYERGGTCKVLDFPDIVNFLIKIGENNGL